MKNLALQSENSVKRSARKSAAIFKLPAYIIQCITRVHMYKKNMNNIHILLSR